MPDIGGDKIRKISAPLIKPATLRQNPGAMAVHMSLAVLCLAIGSLALSYLVWEYHRAWRLRPSTTGSTAALGLRTWPGISVDGVIVRPEYITAALAFLLCVLGMIMYFEASSHPPLPVSTSPPASLLPEAKPLE
jgi:hypothetical protein